MPDHIATMEDTDSDEELPPGWEERSTLDGKVFFVNHLSKSTQWTHPFTGKEKRISSELPYGWKSRIDANGVLLFEDTIGKRQTFTDPRLAYSENLPKYGGKREYRQKFDANTHSLQVLVGKNLHGKYALITGATSGIGLEVCRSLALHDCFVTMICQSEKKGAKVRQQLMAERPEAQVDILQANFTCLKQVLTAVQAYLSSGKPLHYLILNAAVLCPSDAVTSDGLDSTLQVNHIAHFLICQQLIPQILQRVSAEQNAADHNVQKLLLKVIFVSSESHRAVSGQQLNEWLDRRLLSMSPKAGFSASLHAYNVSKLCNLLTAMEMYRRWCVGSQTPEWSRYLRVYACHPGNMVYTQLCRNSCWLKLFFALAWPFSKSQRQAASTVLYCATDRDMEHLNGTYFNNCCPCQASEEARNGRLSRRLWEVTESVLLHAATFHSANYAFH